MKGLEEVEKLGRNVCILPRCSDCRRSYHQIQSHLVDSKSITYGFKHQELASYSDKSQISEKSRGYYC